MAFHFGRQYLCPLTKLLLLYSTSVTSLHISNYENAPKYYSVDPSCSQRFAFTPVTARESVEIAARGSRRLLNLNDAYQAFVFNLLFKQTRNFQESNWDYSEAWSVVEVEGWIGAMKYQNPGEIPDVRIYCDNDARWTQVPDDPNQIRQGMTPNSRRTFGDDQEYEDKINFMRRDPTNTGCQSPVDGLDPTTLGVTYSTMSPPGPNGAPPNYHSPRQTITICDIAFRAAYKQFADILLPEWRNLRIGALNTIPTHVLLYQLLNLDPYQIRSDALMNKVTQDTWTHMMGESTANLEALPGAYAWNAVLAYAADQGWGIQQDLTTAQYAAGTDLFRYQTALRNVPFVFNLRIPDPLPPEVFSPGPYG